ncbi:cellulose biosynthesis protein BcsE [Gibbsiella quercinecans]|uniref:cellulose biosynthesis protein BcsE n=1 Tax=Gibbsiella quercinecans TaxID=929813 RepID=UPI000EF16F35|nr:cellulose biosynthesis protein BcsE [Gibbsiella quercinecans]RLM10228.1 cellulose biosynthesis protein BcsE [Gibbsiella quercinecans]
MAQSFSLGLRQVWEDLSVMQSPGFYWVNSNRQSDAQLFCQQVIAAQQEDSRAALICCGSKPEKLMAGIKAPALKKLPLYTLPEKKAALLSLPDDLMRALNPSHRLLILFVHASQWQTFTSQELHAWADGLRHWLRSRHCTLLILSHGNGVSRLRDQLGTAHQILSGLASLQWQQDSAQYLVSWWSTQKSINANQLLTLVPGELGWQPFEEHGRPLAAASGRNDEEEYLAEIGILEGAPPLSRSWRLFDNNAQLAQHGMLQLAATLIFSLAHTEQIETLAYHIHGLRRLRGDNMKIVVREMKPCLRYSDERLLLACGANLIAPHLAPLSRFLTMLEGVQGQRFPRHVPEDIDILLAGLRPLQVKGYMRPGDFTDTVLKLMENTLLPENGKGVMVALRPAPGLHAEQAMTLCHLRRFGDVMTIIQGQLVLYLSTCRINDLETALQHIFRLPVDEAFSNRKVWYQDTDIISEIKVLGHAQSTTQLGKTALPVFPASAGETAAPTRERRQPVAITLLASNPREPSHAES